jgi:hypothetical protein
MDDSHLGYIFLKIIKKIPLGLWFETWEAYDIITLGIDIVDCIILLTPW